MRLSILSVLGLSCLGFVLAHKDLWVPQNPNTKGLSEPVLNNASVMFERDPFDLGADTEFDAFGLEKRQSCPSGTRYCSYSGRCCPSPADSCCEDGTCAQRSRHICCGGGNLCRTGEKCCRNGCAPDTATCCVGKMSGRHCLAGYKCCEDGCAPEKGQCCRDGGSCEAGYNCVVRSNGRKGCCPDGGCYEASRVIDWYYYIYWYIQVYYEVRVEVTSSSLSLTSSSSRTSSTVTVTASNSASASSVFASLSSSYSSAAARSTPDLDDVSTSTTTSTSSSSRSTSSTRSSSSDDDEDEATLTADDSVGFRPTETAGGGPLPTGAADNGTVFAGDNKAGGILSSHGMWAYVGVAGVYFTMMRFL